MSVATATGSAERSGVVTFKGNPLTLIGPEIRVGDQAPDFQVVAQDLSTVKFSDAKGKVRLLNIVPSLDTPICDAQTRRFNEEAATLPGVEIWTISMDLPFAQKRWCGAFGVDHVKMVSDHREGSFGRGYGTLIKESRIMSRAIFVVDHNNILRHVEYVKEMGEHPNYEAALAAAKSAAGASA